MMGSEVKPADTPSVNDTEPVPGSSVRTTSRGRETRSAYSIAVNTKQKGNPILKFIRNVPWEYGDIEADYEIGQCACALYLSLKYHNRFPEYIHSRLKALGKSYELRILLVQVDTNQQDVSHELGQLARICLLSDFTLILAFSHEEAGRYLELYKAYENKPPTEIMGKSSTDYLSQATDSLTTIKGVNRTDCTTLLTNFKNIRGIINAETDSLSLCPGIGPTKAKRLKTTFTEPFIRATKLPKPVKNDGEESDLGHNGDTGAEPT